MIISERYKNFSLWTPDEHSEEIARELSNLSEEELEAFYHALADPHYEQTLTSLELERDIVPIYDWINDPYYLGDIAQSIYQPWKEDLVELFSSDIYSTAVIIGGIGSGKSTFSHIAILRMLYEASCLRNPARFYGLASGSSISFCNLAKSSETARRVVFEAIVAKLMDIPYFKFDFPPVKDTKNEIIFPKNLQILAGSSTDSSIIGANIFGGIIDEGNFWSQKKKTNAKSEESRFSKRWGSATKAGRLFDAVQRRMKSRYMRHGRVPGVLIVVSSKTTHDSFTETLVLSAQKNNDKTVFVRDRNIIEVKRDVFSDKTFRVLVGNEHWQSKILAEGEDESKYRGATIVEIPEDLRTDFEDNIDESLRDIAGVSTMAISQFMKRPDMVDKMMDQTRRHPFICAIMGDPMQWDSRLPYRINWNQLTKRLDNGEWVPRMNPEAKRHVHFDPALTGDAFGLCIAHIAGTIPVKKFEDSNHEMTEEAPYFIVDFILSIQGEPGEEVIFKNVRQLCYEFSHHGFHLAEFSTDTYQSREMIQALREQGYKAGIYSVDTGQTSADEVGGEYVKDRQLDGTGENKRKQAYRYLRQCIYEQRISCYDYPVLWNELKSLEDGPVMIDHPDGGCFVGETRIPLLDGTCPTIAELDGKEVWVYSCKENGEIVQGKARGRYTKHVSELLDVCLDSGAVIRCTPDHRFMLWDGSYKEAKNIIPGIDRLMPINRHVYKVRYLIPVQLEVPVPVYDLEVDNWNNFALNCGIFVHNSKDLADALAGCIWTLFKADYYMEPMAPIKGLSQNPVNLDPEADILDIDAQVHDGSAAPRKYFKKNKGPQTISPSYKKIGLDGAVTDLVRKPEDYLSRG